MKMLRFSHSVLHKSPAAYNSSWHKFDYMDESLKSVLEKLQYFAWNLQQRIFQNLS